MDPESSSPAKVDLTALPMPVMQALYHEITGKTEVLAKGFKEARRITKNDIEQLSIKLHQVCEQFSVVGENCSYTVRHINSMTQKFSSLEKFKQYDESIPHAIDNITLEYSALIEVPSTKKHYQYKIEVVLESLEFEKVGDVPDYLYAFWDFEWIRIRIEYIDYVVARTFLAAVDEWTLGLEKIPTNKFLNWLRGYVYPPNRLEPLGRLSNVLAGAAAIYAAYKLRDKIVVPNDIFSLANFGLLSFAIYFFTVRFSATFYRIFSSHLLKYQAPNLIVINRADRENFSKFTSTRDSVYRATFVFVLQLTIVIGVNVLSNKIYDLIK